MCGACDVSAARWVFSRKFGVTLEYVTFVFNGDHVLIKSVCLGISACQCILNILISFKLIKLKVKLAFRKLSSI